MSILTHTGKAVLITLALATLTSGAAQAAPIIFNFTGTVSGTISGTAGGTTFTDENVSFFAFGNTTNVAPITGHPGAIGLLVSPVEFAITDIGSGTVLDPVRVFDNQTTSIAGMSDLADMGNDFFDVKSPAFTTYDLKSSLGPIGATSDFGVINVNTTLGEITFTSETRPTFTAIAAPVPEASTTVSFGLLLALGMGGLVIAAKRKKTSAQA